MSGLGRQTSSTGQKGVKETLVLQNQSLLVSAGTGLCTRQREAFIRLDRFAAQAQLRLPPRSIDRQ